MASPTAPPRRAARTAPAAPQRHLRVVRPEDRPRTRPVPTPRAPGSDRAVGMLIVATTALVLVGIAMVLSASSVSAYDRYGSSFLFFNRQVAYAGVGGIAAIVMVRLGYGTWKRLAGPAMILTFGLLLLVLIPGVGRVAGGSARWLAFGPITIQPSELAKLAVVAWAAALLSGRIRRIHDPRVLGKPLVLVSTIVCGAILAQPDMGTAVVVVASVFVVAFAAGARLVHLAIAGATTTVLGVAAIYMEGYRWARFVSALDPWADPLGGGYQTIQSLIGFGSGGLFGVGLGAGRQKWLYVPNAHTDFIYSILGEELGLLGALAVLVLFGLVLYAGTRIALGAPDAFGRLLAAGITGWLGLQAAINLGAVTGLLPITGVPLPFVSFGGSSLVVSLAAVGVLVSIGRARPVRR